MHNLHRIAVPAYLVSALLVVFPLVDTTVTVLPPRASDVAWRFGAAGLFSRALMTPFVGILLTFAVTLLLAKSRALRVISVISGQLAVLLLMVLGLFVLDTLQMRARVVPEARLAFDVAALVAMGKYGLGVLVTGAFSRGAWRAAHGDRPGLRPPGAPPRGRGVVGIGTPA